MGDRRFVLGALSWSVGILLMAHVYRVVITDRQFVRLQQLTTPPMALQPLTANQ